MDNELWKDVVGYEGSYKVSSMGRIQHIDGMVHPIKPARYAMVSLRKDNIVDRVGIHRVVAISFLSNPENKKVVNHKNLDASDNRVTNLEWATYSENAKHWTKIRSETVEHRESQRDKIVSVYYTEKELKEIVKEAIKDDRPLAQFIRIKSLQNIKKDK